MFLASLAKVPNLDFLTMHLPLGNTHLMLNLLCNRQRRTGFPKPNAKQRFSLTKTMATTGAKDEPKTVQSPEGVGRS